MRIARGIILTLTALMLVLPVRAQEAAFEPLRDLLEAAPPVTGSTRLEMPEGIPIVVTFFASWCPPCTPEFRHLNEVLGIVPAGQVTTIGINAFENWGGVENPARMARFLSRTSPKFPLVRGNAAILEAFGGITRIPTVIVYDGAGKEIWRFIHVDGAVKQFATTEEILAALERAAKG